MRYLICIFLILIFTHEVVAQKINIDTISVPTSSLKVVPLFHDSLSSSFFISVPQKVPLHKHLKHTEQIYIVSGEADMILGEKKFQIKKGDVVLIPANTPHAVNVTSREPLKCISIQAPYFDGSDRILLENRTK